MNIRNILMIITLLTLSLTINAEIKVKHYNHEDGLNEYVYDIRQDLVFDEKKVTCSFVAPEVDKPQTIHILLEAFDMAIPRLTSYQRYIITVVPEKK